MGRNPRPCLKRVGHVARRSHLIAMHSDVFIGRAESSMSKVLVFAGDRFHVKHGPMSEFGV